MRIKPELSSSQKQAVITLIEKKGKDRTLLENWRPIALLNVDTKIMSKVIASRLKHVLPSIIHHNQTGFIKDRYIGETVRSIFDIMEFTLKENIPGIMIFLGFQKAFDSVEWDFILECLESFNFGPEFVGWVKTFYKKYPKLYYKQRYDFRLLHFRTWSKARRPPIAISFCLGS